MANDDRTQPTEDDTGKAVIDSTGEEIGIVSAVEDGRIHVETDPGLTDNIKATLGWGDAEDTQTIEPVHVSEITGDAVHLGATDSTATGVDGDAERDEGVGTDTTDPTVETGSGMGHEQEATTDRDDLPPEERRDDPVDGDLSGDETAAEMDDAGDPITERTTGETGADERGVPSGEDDPAGDAVGGMDGRDANERPPGVEDTSGRDDVQDSQLDEPRGTEDVQDPVPDEPRDTEDVREDAEELDPGNSDADPEDQPSSAEAATRGAEEDADLGRDDESDERSS